MLVTIFLTSFFILAGFQFVDYISSLVIVQHIITELFLFCDCGFHRFHLCANITQLLMGDIASSSQCFGRIKSHFLVQQIGSACVFEIVFLCPMLITLTFFLGDIHIHHTAYRVLLFDKILHGRCRMNGRRFRSDLFCISVKDGEHSSFIKIVAQLSCRDRLCAVWCEVGQSPSAFLDGDATAEKFFCKVLKADSIGECHADFFTELVLVGFKLCLFDRQALFDKDSVFFIQCKLSFLLRPILTLGHSCLTSIQQINLIQTCIVAHLHDLRTEVFHSCVGASVLHARLGVARSIHIRYEWNFHNSQRIDNDVYMNIAAAVVPVGVCTDDGLMTGKVFLAEFLSKTLCQIYGQSVIGNILGIKADDIVMTFDIFPFLIFAIAEVGSQTGNRKIFVTAVQCRNAVILSWDKSAVFVQGGLHGELVMLKSEIGFSSRVVGIFRAYMLERCQQHHPPFSSLQISAWQDQRQHLAVLSP